MKISAAYPGYATGLYGAVQLEPLGRSPLCPHVSQFTWRAYLLMSASLRGGRTPLLHSSFLAHYAQGRE